MDDGISVGGTEETTIDYVFKTIDIPWWCYVIAVLIGITVWKTWRWEGGLLGAYVFLILADTVLIRQPFVGQHFQPELFWSWRVWDVQKGQIIANVIMFIPVGILAGWLWRWKGLWFGIGLSCVVELLQMMTSRGLCEFDDVLHNAVGTVIGEGIVMLGCKLFRGEVE